jgi:cytochrome oxidase Cu insertion factor (SCO1/SenC/PrrC family)
MPTDRFYVGRLAVSVVVAIEVVMNRLMFFVSLALLAPLHTGCGMSGETSPLAIGSVAPEIEGEDVDGQPFKLSDYRGKVVVLDFWGDW